MQPFRCLSRAAMRLVIRAMLLGFSAETLREMHARATAELGPDAAETARELIRRELSRRLRKDY